ncbi:hypothetical protein COCCADRAFT_111369 [Bipolaris zeicola 26-R-13]|uniref:Uncharacterized protein n=1 Tax=Cochliobolus carbonum (strain 26-R-13) TaxID=930089 RepID=W6Y913_COCC2|nr:uncharacterized protein COCCADRAFT_111369 [Bipolaris zeicola 26-R-13]EUC27561.1 hypothetical protein COCCADRAFT_111369 [Bipolaris zeicola 26-R-13]
MGSRRLTIFPRTVNGVDNASPITRNDDSSELSAIKRKLHSEEGTLERKLQKFTTPLRVKRKIFTPLDEDPGKFYRCIHIVDPEGERPYCIAQGIASVANENAYRVVMIRRSSGKFFYGLEDPNPNLLNVVSVFRFQDSLFTVFDRPGLPLSEIAVSHSPRLGLAEVKTISAEALSGISAMCDAGLHLPSIDVEDITISATNGQVQVAIHRAYSQEATTNEKATAFGVMLDDLVSRVPDSSTLQHSQDLVAFIQYAAETTYQELKKDKFLRDSLPTPSLIPFVLNAQIIVFPVEYITEAVIADLGTT